MYKLKVGISKEASASSIEMGDKLEFMGTDAARFVDAMVGACGAFLINSVFLIKLGSNQLTVRARRKEKAGNVSQEGKENGPEK